MKSPFEVGTAVGWFGTYPNEEFGPLRSFVWSPEPGVVLEMSVVAERWSIEDSIALAEGITMATPHEWDARYLSE